MEQTLAEKAELESLLNELRQGGGGGETAVATETVEIDGGGSTVYRGVRLRSRDADDARKWGDAFLAGESGVAVVAAEMPGGKRTIFTFDKC